MRGNVFGRGRLWETGSYRWLPQEAAVTNDATATVGTYNIPQYSQQLPCLANGTTLLAMYYQRPQQ